MGDLKVLKSTIENIDGSKSYLLGATMEKQGVSEERTQFPFLCAFSRALQFEYFKRFQILCHCPD